MKFQAHLKNRTCILFLLMVLISSHLLANNGPNDPEAPKGSQDSIPSAPKFKRFGFMDFLGYYDSRGGTTFTLNHLAVLSERFTYFGFVNFQQANFPTAENPDFEYDMDFFYTEQTIYYTPIKKLPFDVSLQAVMIGFGKNDKLRPGINWRAHNTPVLDEILKKLNMRYSATFHVAQIGHQAPLDDFTWQIEHVWYMDILPTLTNKRIYMMGFADQTMGGPLSKGVVAENQIGFRIFDQFHVVAEYRHFSYLPAQFRNGMGYGLQYLMLF